MFRQNFSKSNSNDPWYRATLALNALGATLKLHVPHDVFSNTRIDEGTELLLANLPQREPAFALDMGCGTGALGLPIAARYPSAMVEMVDRDLLAVAWAQKNADANKLSNVRVYGSLGYRDIAPSQRYDWILCNVPARIGEPFIEHLLEAGRALLTAEGELRVVVIRDLAPVLEQLRDRRHLPLTEVARGPRHVIFALAADAAGASGAAGAGPFVAVPPSLYRRDFIEVAGLQIERPHDVHSDDAQFLAKGLPVLLDGLPRQAPKRVLCFRSGYGPLPLTARKRWNAAQVVAIDRDLLATSFVEQNAARLSLGGELLEVRSNAHFPDALKTDERFDLAFGELHAGGGEAVAEAELLALSRVLEKGGQAIILAMDKLERKWIPAIAAKHRLTIYRIIARDGYAVMRLGG